MKTLARPASGSAWSASRSSRRAEPRDQLGAGGDDARLVAGRITSWTGGPGRRIVDLPGRPTPADDRQEVAERLGQQDGVADVARRRSAGRAAGRRPRGPRAGRGRSAGRARRQGLGVAEGPQCLDRGGDARPSCPTRRCRVSRSPSTRGGTNGRWTVSRWPSNCSVRPGPAARRAGRPRRGPRGARRRAARPRSRRRPGSRPGGRPTAPASPVAARDLDQSDGGLDQTSAIDGGPDPFTEPAHGPHHARTPSTGWVPLDAGQPHVGGVLHSPPNRTLFP